MAATTNESPLEVIANAPPKPKSGDHPAVKAFHATMDTCVREARERAEAIRARLSQRLMVSATK